MYEGGYFLKRIAFYGRKCKSRALLQFAGEFGIMADEKKESGGEER